MIEELLKNGYEIHAIAGTSMGALVGGVYAQGKMDDFKNWLYTLDKIKVFQLVDFTFSLQGFVKGEKVLKKMKKTSFPMEILKIYPSTFKRLPLICSTKKKLFSETVVCTMRFSIHLHSYSFYTG